MGFEQATIKVEREQEFEELQGIIVRVLSPGTMDRFLKRLTKDNLRVRDWDSVLSRSVFEKVDEALAKSGKTARSLYESLTVSDQAQIREFYLSKIEQVDAALRHRFKKLYQYY